MRSLGVDAELLQRMMRCVRRGDLPWKGEKDLHLWKKMGMVLKELGVLFEVVLKYDICCFLNCSSPSPSKGRNLPSVHPGQLDADNSGVIDFTEFLAATLESCPWGWGKLEVCFLRKL